MSNVQFRASSPTRKMKILLLLLFITVLYATNTNEKSGCPLDGKCPYVGAHKGEHAGEKGCPLQTGGCPYYDKHAKDQNAADIVASDSASGCPMEKCPYFDVSFLF